MTLRSDPSPARSSATRWGTALAGMVLAGTAAAQDVPPAVNAAIEAAAAECAGFEGGQLAVGDDAVIAADLTGSGNGWVLDFAGLSCSSMASFACGSGGCRVLFGVDDHVTERLAAGWALVEFGPAPVILLDVHGSLCGGINPTPCVEAIVWDGEAGAFSSLAPRDQ